MKGETPRNRNSPPADIARVDDGGFHGWMVTVWKDRLEHKRRFAESEYASASAAFSAAVRFRNRTVSGGAVLPKGSNGIPGISVGKMLTSAGRHVVHYKVSFYTADGARRGRVFSWLKYGKKEALRLAKRALKDGRDAARRSRRLHKREGPGDASRPDRRKFLLARSKPTNHQNVRRVDHNYFRGYVVALGRVQSRHQKYFGDRTFGGRRAALGRALEYRDALLAELPPPVRIHRKTHNSTGIPGVSLVYDRTRSGRIVPRFVAYWPTADGRTLKRSYSTLEHGFAGAQSKAVRVREEGVVQLVRDRKAALLEEIERRKRQRVGVDASRPNPARCL